MRNWSNRLLKWILVGPQCIKRVGNGDFNNLIKTSVVNPMIVPMYNSGCEVVVTLLGQVVTNIENCFIYKGLVGRIMAILERVVESSMQLLSINSEVGKVNLPALLSIIMT